MNKIVSLALITLFLAASAYAEPIDPPASGMIPSKTKIEDLEKLVAEGKARKAGIGAYVLPDRFILNGKEHPKTQYGGVVSSPNSEYFLFRDTNMVPLLEETIKLFNKTGRLLWEQKNSGGDKEASLGVLVSNNGNVFFLYGPWGQVSALDIVDKSGRAIDAFPKENFAPGVTIERLYRNQDAQFAKNSEMLFILAYIPKEQLALLGIDVTGEIKYFEKVTGAPMKDVDNWYARVYFNSTRNQVLIDSNGIGEDPPMLSYWSFPQKKIFNKKTVKDEIIYNASFSDNDDILLLVKKKDGSKVVRRLSPAGKEKGDKSDISKMDAEELQMFREKPVDVRSLRGCENGDKRNPCR